MLVHGLWLAHGTSGTSEVLSYSVKTKLHVMPLLLLVRRILEGPIISNGLHILSGTNVSRAATEPLGLQGLRAKRRQRLKRDRSLQSKGRSQLCRSESWPREIPNSSLLSQVAQLFLKPAVLTTLGGSLFKGVSSELA